MARQPEALRKYKRHLSTARRELVKAVERAQGVDLRAGHLVEAARLAREVRAAADELVRALDA